MYLTNKATASLSVIFFVLITVGHITLRGQGKIMPEADQPKVLKAVAPTFIPFVFGETGIAEIVVEVKIDNEGNVISAKTFSASLFKDISFESAAKKWLFEKSLSDEERKAFIKFILRIMPKETNPADLTTIFHFPAGVEVRSPIIDAPTTSFPLPDVDKSQKQEFDH